MSTSVTFNGTSYTVPAIADASWGTNVSTYLIAIASGCLQKTGGAFTLSQADVDFGATYGLKAVYFKSKTANIASAGVVQLARTDVISWRNQANGADLSLSVDSSNNLSFNGALLVNLALGGAYAVLQMNAGATAYSWATPTGTGAPVLATSPTISSPSLVTPALGVATATSINKMAITAPATSSTLAVADGKTATISATLTFAGTDGKTVTFSNSLTFAGTDGNTMTFPSGSSTVMTLASADTITGIKTFGDGKVVLSGSSSGGMTVKAPAAASTFVATFFAATDTVVGLTFQQTVTNKVFSDSTVKFGNVSDVTKALIFSLGGATTAKTMTFLSSHTNDRTLTFPDATDTLVGKATTDVLTNKTLSGNTATNLISGSGTFTLNTTGTVTAPNATDTLVGKATTDALTNKDYQGGTASNTSRLTVPSAASATLLALTRKQATLVYDTTVNALYSDDGSNLNPVGSGAGEKNYISTGSSNAGGWTASDAGVTVATDTTAGDLPRSITTKSGILVSRASGSTAYAYYRFTLDPADYNTLLKIQFAMKFGASYVASDFKVDMYSNTASNYGGTSARLALSTDSSAVSALPKLTGTYKTAFGSTDSTAPYMELRVGLNASTSGTTLCISDVIVGPGIVIQGAAVSEWQSFTPTGSWSANTTYTGRYRRVGDTMDFDVKVACSGAPTSAGLTINLPTGFTIDTSKLSDTSTSGGNHLTGIVGILDSGVTTYCGEITYTSTTAINIAVVKTDGTYGTDANVTQALPMTFGASDAVTVRCSVPIAEWAGSGTLNVAQNDVEYAASTTGTWDAAAAAANTVYGPSGAVVSGALTTARVKVVQWQTPIQPTDRIFLEYKSDQGASGGWVPAETYIPSGNLPSFSFGALLYGQGAGNQTSVVFNQYSGAGTTYNSTTGALAWATASSGATNGLTAWRLRKISGGQAVGFASATTTTAGLVDSTTQSFGGRKTFTGGVVGNTPFIYHFLQNSTNDGNDNAMADGAVDVALSGVTQSYAGSTCTLTFANTGWYQITIDMHVHIVASFTFSRVICTTGGTSTRYNPFTKYQWDGVDANDDDYSGTATYYANVTSANQTVTFAATYRGNGASNSCNMSIYARPI